MGDRKRGKGLSKYIKMSYTKMTPLIGITGMDFKSLPPEAKLKKNILYAYAFIIKNNEIIYKSNYRNWSFYEIFKKAESMKDHANDWRIHFTAIICEKTFQRQNGKWVLFHMWPGKTEDKEIDRINKEKNKCTAINLNFTIYEE
jgi:hypothetical protein